MAQSVEGGGLELLHRPPLPAPLFFPETSEVGGVQRAFWGLPGDLTHFILLGGPRGKHALR